MPDCSACGEMLTRALFSGKQLKQPAGKRRCDACIAKAGQLADDARVDRHNAMIDRTHNESHNMKAAYDNLPPEERRSLEAIAATRLDEWQELLDGLERDAEFGEAVKDPYLREPADDRFNILGWSRLRGDENEICIVHDVLTPEQCDAAISAVTARAAARGGWDVERHKKYPTTDMRCSQACTDAPDIEQMLRAAVFTKVCEPLATRWAGAGFLAEHLVFKDFFFVHYSAAEGEQRGLNMHQDGSLFSFNVLLNDPSEFDGGGTFFSQPGWPEGHGKTVSVPRGAALVHSGSLRHGGRDITRGTREILVGFMGVPDPTPEPPELTADGAVTADACAAAARHGFHKFGRGAWSRNEAALGDFLPLSTNASRVAVPTK